MMNFFARAGLSLLEKELVAHSPEIQDFILKQLNHVGIEIFKFLDKKLLPTSNSKPTVSVRPNHG